MIYADSSFLVSLYLRDGNSRAARSEIESHTDGVALSRLAGLEVRNAFRLAVFRGWVEEDQERRVQSLFESDGCGGFLYPLVFASDEIFAVAEHLSRTFTATSGNRSLDIMHIACAQVAELTVFASFDERQRKLASLVGLQVVP